MKISSKPINNFKMFLSIFILGLALRLLSLNAHDFWFDEAYTYQIAKLPLKELAAAALADNNPPFYYLLIHLILKRLEMEEV